MAVDFIKNPRPDEGSKPPKIDFWKPEHGPLPSPASASLGRVEEKVASGESLVPAIEEQLHTAHQEAATQSAEKAPANIRDSIEKQSVKKRGK